MIQIRRKWYSYIFIILVIMFVVQNPLQTILPPMRYMDELFAACIVPLIIIRGIKNNFYCTVSLRLLLVIVFLFLFVICGIYSNLTLRYQPVQTALADVYLNLKFFLAIGAGYLLFIDSDINYVFCDSWKWVKKISVLLFFLCVCDLVFHIFPSEMRYGLRVVYLFYSVHTYLVAACVFLCALLLRLYEYYKDAVFPYLCMLGFVTICTLRMKAIGAIICIFFIYFIICRKRKEFGVITWITIGLAMSLVASRQFLYYFYSMGTESARAALTQVSFRIARDYFPLGCGFGTFASAFSNQPYSKVYYLYHIQNVWGISKNYSSFISDTFWPMILGQNGYLGLIFYIVVLVILFSFFFELRKYNACSFASALTGILYLLISSTSESAFVNTMAVSLAFLLGVHLANLKNIKDRR